MLTLKRVLAALALWGGADIIAMVILTTTHIISVEGHPSRLSEGAQFVIWFMVSIALGFVCFRLSWAKIK
jgi:hypothetical protein